MKSTKVWYWVFTGLFAAFMAVSSISNIMVNKDSIDIFTQLGYPVYLIPFLGIAKFLGAIALVVPGYPRIREWAYAGLTFDLLGATYSSIMVEGLQPPIFLMLVFFIFIGGSYFFYHKRLRESGNSAMSAAQAG